MKPRHRIGLAMVLAATAAWWTACFGRVEGRTLLMQEAHLNNPGMIRFLVLLGADVNAEDRGHHREGFTPLALALEDGGTAAARLLLAAGADPNALPPNHLDLRPMCVAVASPLTGIDALELLLNYGGKLEHKAEGVSALECLHRNWGRLDKLAFLIDHGADPNWRTRAGKSLVELYSNSHLEDVLDALRKRGAA